MPDSKLIVEPQEAALSRANHSLCEYVLPTERASGPKAIRNHVVLKADLRGSTALTAELLENNLNPASFFSLNFFGPINHLVEDFGATKVFIEGDAVILAIFEREVSGDPGRSVALACGLARKILEVVDTQNARSRAKGLPGLEIGLGIVFSDGAPAFLYDGEHRIMISRAINRADRLSSCSRDLRGSALAHIASGRGVEVVAIPDEKPSSDPEVDGLLRFNVNGIELDAPAFFKLKAELRMHRVELPEPSGRGMGCFHAGRYADVKGRRHWVVVREAPVRVWIGNDFSSFERRGRRFYQVVADRELAERVIAEVERGPATPPGSNAFAAARRAGRPLSE